MSPLRILWLTNWPLPDMSVALGMPPIPRIGWLPALAEVLVKSSQVRLAVATNVAVADWDTQTIHGIRYYAIPTGKKRIDGRHLPRHVVEAYQQVVADFRPDLIHIQGTEHFHGLLTGRGYITCPAVISIQGILDVAHRYYCGGLSTMELLRARTLRDWVRFDGVIEQRTRWARRAKWEREVFATNSAFIGQTLWDRAHLRRLNPGAKYYHHDRMLREEFYDSKWNVGEINRHSIFVSSALYPLKGFHILVKAAAILRHEFPDIAIRATLAHFYPELTGVRRFWKDQRSVGYFKYLTDLIRSNGLEENVVPIPPLDAKGMAREYSQAHVFVAPSLVENESISLAEAMLIGTPSVASYAGGMPSLAEQHQSVLFFPPGDEAVLAEQIRRIFLDDGLAHLLSERARMEAGTRHKRDRVVSDILSIYEETARRGRATPVVIAARASVVE